MANPAGTVLIGGGNVTDRARRSLLRAIQTEAHNAGIYESFAQLFQEFEGPLAVIFRRMAAEELRYGTELERCYCAQFGALPFTNEEPKTVIELPRPGASQPSIFDYVMTLEQALTAALRVVERAEKFYTQEALHTSNSELQQIYQRLAQLGQVHRRILQEKLATAADFTSR